MPDIITDTLPHAPQRVPENGTGEVVSPVLAPVPAEVPTNFAVIPESEDWITLPPPYDHMKIRIWLDFPGSLNAELNVRGDENRVRAAAKRVFLEHNHWAFRNHETGEMEELPQPNEDAFWDLVPTRIMVQAFRALNTMLQSPPNLPARTNRR